jgi:anaerobic ribonucleoside-triphosphate reductase activating protein
MPETTWIIDAKSGELTIEGLQRSELTGLAGDLLPPGKQVNCARPIDIEPLRIPSARTASGEPSLRVYRIYHNSVVEGPGRRSVLQTAGCLLRCIGCHAVETHSMGSGVEMNIAEIVERLLAPEGEPRDGVTILGGEPFLQLGGLLALMRSLKQRDQHITLYTGYTLDDLAGRNDRTISQILEFTDILIDGPFIKELSDNAGEYIGSTNQRVIRRPAFYVSNNLLA